MDLSSSSLSIHANYASQTLAPEHVLKCLVDLRERDRVSDELIQFKLLQHQEMTRLFFIGIGIEENRDVPQVRKCIRMHQTDVRVA